MKVRRHAKYKYINTIYAILVLKHLKLLLVSSIKVYIFIHTGIFASKKILVHLYWRIIYLLFFFLLFFIYFSFFIRFFFLFLFVVVVGYSEAGFTFLIITCILLCGTTLHLLITIFIFVEIFVYVISGILVVGEQVRVKLEKSSAGHKLHLRAIASTLGFLSQHFLFKFLLFTFSLVSFPLHECFVCDRGQAIGRQLSSLLLNFLFKR